MPRATDNDFTRIRFESSFARQTSVNQSVIDESYVQYQIAASKNALASQPQNRSFVDVTTHFKQRIRTVWAAERNCLLIIYVYTAKPNVGKDIFAVCFNIIEIHEFWNIHRQAPFLGLLVMLKAIQW